MSFSLVFEALPNSAPVAPILREGPSSEEEGGDEEKEGGEEERGEEEEEGKTPRWIWRWKEEEREAKGGTSEGREEEVGTLGPCVSPDS